MNVIIKMMDADNKGFRLLTVGEPVDVHVRAFDEASMTNPSLTVNHGVSPSTKSYPLVGNAYIMNEAGDTISKIDFVEVSKGMAPGSGKNMVAMAFKGDSLYLTAGNGNGVDPEEHDYGTILTHWEALDNKLGVYIEGFLKTPEELTSVIIRRYKVYAKQDIIEELRKMGTFPEAKLAMLKANNDLVDPPLTTVTLKENGDTEIASAGQITLHRPVRPGFEECWHKLTSHLGLDTAVLLSNTLCTYVIDKGQPAYACVNGQNIKHTRVIVGGKVVLACSGNTAFPSDSQSFKTEGLKQAWDELRTDYQWFTFAPAGDTRTVDVFGIQPTGNFNDLVDGKSLLNPVEVI